MAGFTVPKSVAVRVGLKAYLSTDHITPATGKTIAITISKNGGAFGNPSAGATNATEVSSGWYYVDLSTTDTGTAGPLMILGQVATIDNIDALYLVQDTAVAQTGVNVVSIAANAITATSINADAITAAKVADGTIDAATFASSAITATAIASDAITAAKIADGAIDAATFAAGAITATVIADNAIDAGAIAATGITKIVDGVWDAVMADYHDPDTTGEKLFNAPVTGDTDEIIFAVQNIQTRLPTLLVGGRMDSSVGAMSANTLTASALATDAVSEITTAIQALVLETGLTWKQALQVIAASVGGKLSGAATTTIAIKNAVADDKTRITATVDSDGNRTAIVYDLT